MAAPFPFELVSPEKQLVSGEALEVTIPGTDGYFQVLANHAPLMSTIKPGIMVVQMADGKTDKYIIYGGFADVSPAGLTVLAESSVHVDDFDKADLQSRIDQAEAEVAAATAHHAKSAAMEFLDQLTSLNSNINNGV